MNNKYANYVNNSGGSYLINYSEIYKYCDESDHNAITLFNEYCKMNKKDVAELIYMRYKKIVKRSAFGFDTAFVGSCEHECIDVVKWLLSLNFYGNGNQKTHGYVIYYTGIQVACVNGNIELVQLIYNSIEMKYLHAVNLKYSTLFEKACHCNNLEIATWLHSMRDIDEYHRIEAFDGNKNRSELFLELCKKKSFKTAELLNNLGIFHEDAFMLSCLEQNDLILAKWLYELKNPKIKINLKNLYEYFISHPFQKMSKHEWLCSLLEIPTTTKKDNG